MAFGIDAIEVFRTIERDEEDVFGGVGQRAVFG